MNKKITHAVVVFMFLTGSGVLCQTVEVQNKTLAPIGIFVRGHDTVERTEPYQAAALHPGETKVFSVRRDQLGLSAGESHYDLTATQAVDTVVGTMIPADLSFPLGACSGLSADGDAKVIIEQGLAGALKTTCKLNN